MLWIDHFLQQLARIRTCDGKLRPGFGCRDQLHVHVWVKALTHELHVAINAHSIGRRRGDNEVIFGKACRRAVIHRDPVFSQHQPIADLAHGEFRKSIGVYLIQKVSRICALNVDLAQSGHVTDAHGFPGLENLTIHRLPPMGFTRFREPLRA